MNPDSGITMLTPSEAASRLLAAHQGNITIHRRPKSGSVPCFGKCGRQISANKALCLECARKAEAVAATQQEASSS